MARNYSGNRDILKDRQRDQIIGLRRDEFMGFFSVPEMKTLARKVFDVYVAAGGDFKEEDMGHLKEIVEDNSSQGEEIGILIRCAMDEVRFMIFGNNKAGKVKNLQPLPKTGIASADPKGGNALEEEFAPELRQLRELQKFRANSITLRPPRVPRGMGPTAETPAESGVTLLSSISWPGKEKQQA